MKKPTIHFILLALLLLGLSWWNSSSLVFFNSDVGLRFRQAQELIVHQWETFAISYPAPTLDPDLEFIPLYCAYSVLQGQLFFNITPFVPLIASFLVAWLGPIGIVFISALGGFLAAAGVYKIAKLAQIRHALLAFWAAILATPLFFYSLHLWDHTPAVACAVWGVYYAAWGLVNKKWSAVFLAGILFAFGIGQRPEMYMFTIALVISLLIVSRLRWQLLLSFAAGGLTGMIPIWWLQWRWFGHPLGMAVATNLLGYGRPEQYAFTCQGQIHSVQVSRFLLYIGSHDYRSFAAAILAILGIFLFIFVLRIPRWQRPLPLWAAFILTLSGYLIWGSMIWQNVLPGLITTFPLLGFSLVYLEKPKEEQRNNYPIYQLSLLTTLFFLAGMLLFWPAYGGDHWGARYLLPVYPLLIFLAFYVYETYERQEKLQKSLRIVGVSLLVLTIGLQLIGIRHIFVSLKTNKTLYQAIDALPTETIITNHPFLPTTLISLWDRKTFLYVDDENDIETLITRMDDNEISRFAFISLLDLPLSVPTQVEDIMVKQVTPVIYKLEKNDDS
ncbi:MAG: hypothetical protein KC421_19995 [Anaerolineales bacterium]|nr:hypothetical protein [Anaerolineales bacterium]